MVSFDDIMMRLLFPGTKPEPKPEKPETLDEYIDKEVPRRLRGRAKEALRLRPISYAHYEVDDERFEKGWERANSSSLAYESAGGFILDRSIPTAIMLGGYALLKGMSGEPVSPEELTIVAGAVTGTQAVRDARREVKAVRAKQDAFFETEMPFTVMDTRMAQYGTKPEFADDHTATLDINPFRINYDPGDRTVTLSWDKHSYSDSENESRSISKRIAMRHDHVGIQEDIESLARHLPYRQRGAFADRAKEVVHEANSRYETRKSA